jgi:hypothetical protein
MSAVTATADGLLGEPCLPLPTVEGKVTGIVGLDPLVLQCADCGSTLTQPDQRSVAVFVVTSGWHFHVCEGRQGVRRCRECLARVKAGCPSGRCKA